MRLDRLFRLAPVAFVAVAACADVDPTVPPALHSGSADFTRMVALGNSLTAGYQSGGLVEARQRHSYPALIARQMGKRVLSNAEESPAAAPGEFVIPGYGAPGTAGSLRLLSLVPLAYSVVSAEEAGSPANATYSAAYNNLGIPLARVGELLHAESVPGNNSFPLVLRGRGTAVTQALSLAPTFVLLWAGSSDVLTGILAGDPVALTPAVAFERDFAELIETLVGDQDARPPVAPGVIAANVPSVTTIPFVTTIPPFVVHPITGARIPLLGPDGPLRAPGPNGTGDFVLLLALEALRDGYGFPAGADTDGDGQPDGKGPLPGDLVLTQEEVVVIQDRVEIFNEIIASVCGEYGIPVVDVDALLRRVRDEGLTIGGIHYTQEFLLGGLFSLDGVHPTDVGQAIIANAFLAAINDTYGATLAPVDLAAVMGFRFGAEPVGKGTNWRDLDARAMREMFDSPLFRAMRGEMSQP